MIKKWFGVARFVYNKTIEYLQQPDIKANWKAIKGGILNDLPEWCKEVPYQIKSIGSVNAEVTLAIAPGVELVSIVTRTSADKLGLKRGKEVFAVIKSHSVMIAAASG